MTILEKLIAPLSLKEFSDQHLFKMPFAAPFAAQDFKNLISWDLLGEILSSGHPDCWLPQQGLLPIDSSLATGRLTIKEARAGFEQGRTLLVRHAEKAHPKLKVIADNFHQVFQDPIDIQLYCTPPNQEGFDWHYDSEEVFVIQSVGEKEFRLRRNTINPWPLHFKVPKNMHFEQERPSPEIRCLLKAGDWLYIPSGWWHKAKAQTESCHLSVGVMALSGYGYLESLMPSLEANPLWQQRLPLRGPAVLTGAAGDEDRKACRAALQGLKSHISWLLDNEEKFFKTVDPGVEINKKTTK
jgi:50S ribosomal protein L16 3-hydroxylase